MRVRDLSVWYPVRRGFLRDVFARSSAWLRAVDGVSFDLRRGEIFCLVGESGCGKTTTGKALLRLVDANAGDVFFEMPDAAFERYEGLRAQGDGSSGEVDELRQQYSLSWKESRKWSPRDFLGLIAAFGAASLIAMAIPALFVGLLSAGVALAGSWSILGFGLAVGFLLGSVTSVMPARPNKRVAALVAFLAIAELAFAQTLAFILFGQIQGSPSVDVGQSYGNLWSTDPFAMLLAYTFAPILGAGVTNVVIGMRVQAEGRGGIIMRNLRRRLHLIFQDPYESLNPKQSVYEIVSEPLQVNRMATSPEETSERVNRALTDAGLSPPEEFLFRFPHELSGGQRQRVSIAAALVLEPDFIVADEPVSMLDVSIRTEILQLLLELRRIRGLTYLFITHDLSLAWVIADRIAVMYLGKVVEVGTAEQVIASPKHPYTKALISVVPSPDPRKKVERMILKGERPDPENIPTGCRFHPRCPVAFERCGWNATEVAEELETLAKEGRLPAASEFRPKDSRTIEWGLSAALSAEQAAEALRSLVAAEKDVRLALRGIADIRTGPDSLVVVLHEWTEPELLEIQAGNAVACHLVNPPETIETITAEAG